MQERRRLYLLYSYSAIEQALSALAPTHTEAFQIHLAGLEKKLEALDRSFEQAFSELKDQPLVFSHPVYQL